MSPRHQRLSFRATRPKRRLSARMKLMRQNRHTRHLGQLHHTLTTSTNSNASTKRRPIKWSMPITMQRALHDLHHPQPRAASSTPPSSITLPAHPNPNRQHTHTRMGLLSPSARPRRRQDQLQWQEAAPSQGTKTRLPAQPSRSDQELQQQRQWRQQRASIHHCHPVQPRGIRSTITWSRAQG